MSKKQSIDFLEIAEILRDVLQSLEDTNAPKSFIRQYVRSSRETASIALQDENIEEFTKISDNLTQHIFLKWFMEKWPDYVASISMMWREFGWINFRPEPPEIIFYYKYLKVFQDAVRYSFITQFELSRIFEVLNYFDQALIVTRKWPEDFRVASSFPYIGIEQALILAHRADKVSENDFIAIYQVLLKAPVLSQQTSQYAKALDDIIQRVFNWEYWPIHFMENSTSRDGWGDCRNEILLALTVRLACEKASGDWAENLSLQDLEHMGRIVADPEFNAMLEMLRPGENGIDVGVLIERKHRELTERIADSVAASELDPQSVEKFFNDAIEAVRNYKTTFVKHFQNFSNETQKDSEKVLRTNLDKRNFLKPIDRVHYQLGPEMFFGAQSEIDEGHLIEKLVSFASDSKGIHSEFAKCEIADSKEVIEAVLGDSIEGGVVVCINLDWHERQKLRSALYENTEIFDVTHRYNDFRKSIICMVSANDVSWNQFKIIETDGQVLAEKLIDNDRFSIEIHQDETNPVEVVVKLRQSYEIERLVGSNIAQILFEPRDKQ